MQSDMKSISAPHSEGLSEAAVQRSRTSTGRTSGPTRRSTKGQWTAEEDEILRRAVQRFKGKNWKKIAECFKDRTDVQCLHRWQKVLNPELVKGPWSKEEDEIIVEMVHRYGPKKWSTIAQHLPGRIGKQCRERWHNHLNPSINKEAWTQEEELALIRAHQIYGNRWAELTKLLPGRTDNSIKNHWNSSVKKKLDSYLASGLLEQFQGLPLVAHQNQRTSSTSLRLHGSGDDNGVKCGTVAEETSECSRESMVGCSQSASDLNNTVLPTREEFRFTEEADTIKEQSSSPVSCSEQYYVPEIPSEVGTSCSYFQTFSHNIVTSAMGDYQFHIPEIPNIPCVELEQDSSGFPTHYIAANENHEMLNAPFQSSMDLSGSTSMGHIALDSAKLDRILISDDECCRILFSDIMHSGLPPGDLTEGSNMGALGGSSDVVDVGGGSNVVDSEGGMDSLLLGCSNIPISENDGTSASLSYCPPNSDLLGTSCSELLVSGPPLADDNTLVCHKECSQGPSFGSNKQDYTSIAHDGFIYHNDAASSPCEEEGANTTGLHDQTYLEESSNLVPASSPCEEGTNTTCLHDQTYLEESSNLVPVNGFTSCSDTINSPVGVKQNLHTGRQDAGALCYEPPRFPSLDVPFLSCDLIQSGSDMQQEYSPLGIRQLMMSSMNCITPFRLWDSPLRDGSPDAVLKSAAKTFTGTPSILKKRSRDLLSPLSDRRVDKKLYLTCSLTKEFSRLDVMLEEDVTNKSSLSSDSKKSQGSSGEDKENLDPALEGGEEMVDRGDGKTKVHTDGTAQNLQHPPAVHVEDNLTDMLLFSPEQLGIRVDRAFCPSSRTPKNLYRKILGTLSEQAMASETISGNPCLVVNSPVSSKKNHATHLVSATSTQSVDNVTDNATTDVAFENFGRFGGTPFKRSIESPSAWKSPWFINSFVPGPRVDTEISIEDMGFFLSPGDRSYDAIAIMKQLNEQTASAYADALEVLGNETPKTIMKDKHPDKQKEVDQEEPASSHPANMASNVLTERRTLDFSECGTPGKQTENGKSSNAMTFSSPSSYLLKGCR